VNKSKITKIHLVEEIPSTAQADENWDASEEQDGSIPCVISGTELYISSNGAKKIIANTDSSNMFSMFSSVTEITGLDILDTSNVTNMSYMFRNCSNLKSIDLSKFVISDGCKTSSALEDCGANVPDFKCIVADEKMANWVEEQLEE
jgi:surface protein